jgi:hypothetical protein
LHCAKFVQVDFTQAVYCSIRAVAESGDYTLIVQNRVGALACT